LSREEGRRKTSQRKELRGKRSLVCKIMKSIESGGFLKVTVMAEEGLEIGRDEARMPVMAMNQVRRKGDTFQSFKGCPAKIEKTFSIIWIPSCWSAIEKFTVVIPVMFDQIQRDSVIKPRFKKRSNFSSPSYQNCKVRDDHFNMCVILPDLPVKGDDHDDFMTQSPESLWQCPNDIS